LCSGTPQYFQMKLICFLSLFLFVSGLSAFFSLPVAVDPEYSPAALVPSVTDTILVSRHASGTPCFVFDIEPSIRLFFSDTKCIERCYSDEEQLCCSHHLGYWTFKSSDRTPYEEVREYAVFDKEKKKKKRNYYNEFIELCALLTSFYRGDDLNRYYKFKVDGTMYYYNSDSLVSDFRCDLQRHYKLELRPVLYKDQAGQHVLGESFLSLLCCRVSSLELAVGDKGYRVEIVPHSRSRDLHFTQSSLRLPLEIKTLYGVTLDLVVVDIVQTVGSLKRSIERLTGVQAAAQSLVYDGHELSDGYPLWHYPIPPFATVYMCQKLRGGSKVHKCSDLTCKCSHHNAIAGCCSVCRISCKCDPCRSADINAVPLVKTERDMVHEGLLERADSDTSREVKEQLVERYVAT
jgi:Ubiquitin family